MPKSKKNAKNSKKTNLKKGKKFWWFFVNIILCFVFLYGVYIVLTDFESWRDGLSLIVLALIIVFLIRLYHKIKRK